jgi:hypothetical protein
VIDTGFNLMAVTTKKYAQFNYFTIDESHPDFAATGLKTTSYVIGDTIAAGDRRKVLRVVFYQGT